MKKLKLKLAKLDGLRMTVDQMKRIIGGNGSDSKGKCSYRCCTPQHTNCSEYVSSDRECTTYADCAGGNASCTSGHLFYNCF